MASHPRFLCGVCQLETDDLNAHLLDCDQSSHGEKELVLGVLGQNEQGQAGYQMTRYSSTFGMVKEQLISTNTEVTFIDNKVFFQPKVIPREEDFVRLLYVCGICQSSTNDINEHILYCDLPSHGHREVKFGCLGVNDEGQLGYQYVSFGSTFRMIRNKIICSDTEVAVVELL